MRFIEYHKSTGRFWFRIFGRGLSIVDRVINPPLFSLRNGYRKALWLGNWTIQGLSLEGIIH